MKTTKQIADELNVSKQKVYRYIKRHNIEPARQENGVMYFDDASEYLIKQGFEAHRSTSQNTSSETRQSVSSDALLDLLQNELQAKDKQIEELNARLAEATAALTQTATALQAAQALHAGTMQQQLEAPKKGGFFSKWKKQK